MAERNGPPAGRGAFIFLLLAVFLQPRLRAEVLPPGQISDPVPCLHDGEQSYALYLPQAYQAARRWPIIYCFDPGGRGAVPVALFREGAEKFGFILVSSNNSRNGPWDVILKAARAIWSDTHARLAIDDQRVYAVGFSGGARVACALGKILSIKLCGVIACGAGLPEWLTPADVSEVPWFGTVGIRDFNYQEMQELERRLRVQGTPGLLRVFQGKHSWPPQKLALEAVAWLHALAADPGLKPQK